MECCNGFVDSVNPLDPKDPKWQKSAKFGPDKDCLVVWKFLIFSIIYGIILPIDELIFFKVVGNGKSSQLTFTPSFFRGVGGSTTNQRRCCGNQDLCIRING
jgi:hypothetical protein